MKYFVVAALALSLSACSTVPTTDQVDMIKNACNVDAAMRPTVSALLAVPGLSTASEQLAISTARAAIDPICANPTGTPLVNAQTILAQQTGNIMGIIATLQARKAGAVPVAK
jgi:hypothetical protein